MKDPPTITGRQGWPVLKEMISQRSLLRGLEAMANILGPVFQVKLPAFRPIVLSGPETARQVLVTDRDRFLWRNEKDPVTRLLRHGLLVEDGQSHDILRSYMQPHLNRSQVEDHLPKMLAYTDQILSTWGDESIKDILVEMRRLTLLILIGTLFRVDATPDLDRIWRPILQVLKFISPGLWLIAPSLPRLGYQAAVNELDEYLFGIISDRRQNLDDSSDMLSDLVRQEGMSDDLIRDQLLTMLIAGHDTSTALLAWSLHLLGQHPPILKNLQIEVDSIIGDRIPEITNLPKLRLLDQVIKESLRLYPPIHAGNRLANEDLQVNGCPIPKGSRILFSIYLTQRDEKIWSDAQQFCPDRFERNTSNKRPTLSYLPFGAGPRNCIGALFAQIEAKAVLARIIQSYDFEPVPGRVAMHMGATLEPRPGVLMKVTRRHSPPRNLVSIS